MKCEIIEIIIFLASLVINITPSKAQFLEPECGAQGISKRVVNGTDAERGLYPWMALIHEGRHLICGGTLINHWFVMSAAHCFSQTRNGVTVSLGVYNRNDLDPAGLYQIARVFKHWSYVKFNKGSDIALLKLARKVEFTAHIRPICILTDTQINVHRTPWFLAIGWGRTVLDGRSSTILQTQLIERRDCSECGCRLDSQICTVAESGTICYGDSGGPVVRELMIHGKSSTVQLGVTSYITDDCRKHAVFSDVLNHTMWIQFIVGLHTPNDEWSKMYYFLFLKLCTVDDSPRSDDEHRECDAQEDFYIESKY